MRIISGTKGGLHLATLGKGDAAAHLRPTSDRVRESLFNVLTGGAYGDPITGARVLDLFAGTGALGLEALSRGAAHASFVDNGKKALALIRQNVKLCRAGKETAIIRADAARIGPNPGAPFSIVFLDPPYGMGLGEAALSASLRGGWIADGALIVLEENAPQQPMDGFELHDQRRYGNTWITIMGARI